MKRLISVLSLLSVLSVGSAVWAKEPVKAPAASPTSVSAEALRPYEEALALTEQMAEIAQKSGSDCAQFGRALETFAQKNQENFKKMRQREAAQDPKLTAQAQTILGPRIADAMGRLMPVVVKCKEDDAVRRAFSALDGEGAKAAPAAGEGAKAAPAAGEAVKGTGEGAKAAKGTGEAAKGTGEGAAKAAPPSYEAGVESLEALAKLSQQHGADCDAYARALEGFGQAHRAPLAQFKAMAGGQGGAEARAARARLKPRIEAAIKQVMPALMRCGHNEKVRSAGRLLN